MPQLVYHTRVVGLFHELNISLVTTFYMEGKVIFFSPVQKNGGLTVMQFARNFKRPTGMAVSENRMYLSTHSEIMIFNGSKILAKNHIEKPNVYDILFQPTASFHTGYLDHHDAAIVQNQYTSVSTLFSCLGLCDGMHSFVPIWKPPFITQLAPQDRCHLNGIATEDNKAKYVSAFCEGDKDHSWRDLPITEGLVLDVEKNAILAKGFIRPHSPRIYKNELYLLNSGEGSLVKINRKTGEVETLAKLPGFTRGMAFYDDYVFIGLSKLRTEKNPLAKEFPVYSDGAELKSGIAVWHLASNSLVGFLEYQTEITELFDINILPNYTRPCILNTTAEIFQKAFVFPHDAYWELEKEDESADETEQAQNPK